MGIAVVMQKIMMIFAVLYILQTLLIAPVKPDEKKEQPIDPPGNIMVEIRWPDGLDDDIDLWVEAPGDDKPVGYSNKSGKTFNLLRDDRGMVDDSTLLNYEMAYGRGLPAGEYTVNLHYFEHRGDTPEEVPVTVTISVKKPDDEKMKQIITRKVTMKQKGDEVTVVRFTLDDKGNLEESTVNDLYKELRIWAPPTSSETP